MSKCAVQTFEKFDSACIAALRDRLGADIPEPVPGAIAPVDGVASRAGFTIAWTYQPAEQTLTVQCTDSPFVVPCSVIEPQLKSWVLACYPDPPARQTP